MTQTDKKDTTEELKHVIGFCFNVFNATYSGKQIEVVNKLTSKIPKSSKMYSGGLLMGGLQW